MFRRKELEQVDRGSFEYVVVLEGDKSKAIGTVEKLADLAPPIWMWRITVGERARCERGCAEPIGSQGLDTACLERLCGVPTRML